jgi:hypothetical protein
MQNSNPSEIVGLIARHFAVSSDGAVYAVDIRVS